MVEYTVELGRTNVDPFGVHGAYVYATLYQGPLCSERPQENIKSGCEAPPPISDCVVPSDTAKLPVFVLFNPNVSFQYLENLDPQWIIKEWWPNQVTFRGVCTADTRIYAEYIMTDDTDAEYEAQYLALVAKVLQTNEYRVMLWAPVSLYKASSDVLTLVVRIVHYLT